MYWHFSWWELPVVMMLVIAEWWVHGASNETDA